MISIWIGGACHANHQVELQAVVAPGHVQSRDDDAQPSANAQHHPIHDGRHPAHTGHTANMPTTWLQVRRLCKRQSQNLQVITCRKPQSCPCCKYITMPIISNPTNMPRPISQHATTCQDKAKHYTSTTQMIQDMCVKIKPRISQAQPT